VTSSNLTADELIIRPKASQVLMVLGTLHLPTGLLFKPLIVFVFDVEFRVFSIFNKTNGSPRGPNPEGNKPVSDLIGSN